jgi:DNA polymerase-3 subunit beta
MRLSENQIMLVLDNVEIISRLIEGNFPEYESIIPKDTETISVLDAVEFQNALKLCNLFAKETGGTIKLKIEKDKVVVSSSASLVGENTSTILAQNEGPEVEISFNARFLLDVLGVVSSPSVSLGVTGKFNPALIRIPHKNDFLYLIMPLREG